MQLRSIKETSYEDIAFNSVSSFYSKSNQLSKIQNEESGCMWGVDGVDSFFFLKSTFIVDRPLLCQLSVFFSLEIQ